MIEGFTGWEAPVSDTAAALAVKLKITDQAPEFMSPKAFEQKIDQMVADSGNTITHMDAILELIEQGEFDYEDMTKLCSRKSMRQKIENCARALNYMPKLDTLDDL